MANLKPVANAVSASGAEDGGPIPITLTGSDADGSVAFFAVSKLPKTGTLYLDGAMTIPLSPGTLYPASGNALTLFFNPAPDFSGTASFQYYAADNLNLASSRVNAVVNVTPVNDAPVASNVSVSGREDTALTLKLSATDKDGSVASFVIDDLPAGGTLCLNKNGTGVIAAGDIIPAKAKLYFVPNANWNGTTDFHYRAVDNSGTQSISGATATITLTSINDGPVTNNVSATGSAAAPIKITLTGDDPDGVVSGFRLEKLPPASMGQLFLDAAMTMPVAARQILPGNLETATLYFKANPAFTGTATFTYAAIDNQGIGATVRGTASITVTSEPPPSSATSVQILSHSKSDADTAANSVSDFAGLSSDGRYAVFTSFASDIAPTEANTHQDLFWYDAEANGGEGALSLVSRAFGTTGTTAGGTSNFVAMSAAGHHVVFSSVAGDIAQIDTNNNTDLFLYDAQANGGTGGVALITRVFGTTSTAANGGSVFESISSDGRYALFTSSATNMAQVDTNGTSDVFIYDAQANGGQGGVSLVSRAFGTTSTAGDNFSEFVAASEDGRYTFFSSLASNIAQTATAGADLFVYDAQANGGTGGVLLITRLFGTTGQEASGAEFLRGMSSDGRYAVIDSDANDMAQSDSGFDWDVFLFDAQANAGTGGLILVSRAFGTSGTGGNGDSFFEGMSADGRYVAFSSTAADIAQTDPVFGRDIFLFDAQANGGTGGISLVSRAFGTATTAGNGQSIFNAISADGRFVVFSSDASDIAQNDVNNHLRDIFLYDAEANGGAGSVTLVSRAFGTTDTTVAASSLFEAQSDDGRYVVFSSTANNIAQSDSNLTSDLFLFDAQANGGAGGVALISRAFGTAGTTAAQTSTLQAVSADGRFVVFSSTANNIAQTDSNSASDLFLYDAEANDGAGTVMLISQAFGSAGTAANGASTYLGMSDSGRYIAFSSVATDMVSADFNGVADLFVFDAVTGMVRLVSESKTGGVANGAATFLDVFDDGTVYFESSAGNIAATDINAQNDVFRWNHNNVVANQTVNGTAGNDFLSGHGGTDTVSGAGGNDVLDGGNGNDTLNGGTGDDRMLGGLGADTLTGGDGGDTFVFAAVNDSAPLTPDTIVDFVHAVDRIDLSHIDAQRTAIGDQDFLFGGQNNSVIANSVTWHETGGNTIVQADIDGDTTADFVVILNGTGKGLTAGDFFL